MGGDRGMSTREYTIGQFSIISHMPVKTLRFYHERGVLYPSRIDESSGYRYYDDAAVERSRVVTTLRRLDFSLDEIVSILAECAEDEQAIDFLRRKAREVHREVRRFRSIERELNQILLTIESQDSEGTKMEIKQKHIEQLAVITLRYTGRYDEMGSRIGTLFKIAGRFVAGAPFALYWDAEYREKDADIEVSLALKPETLDKTVAAAERYAGAAGGNAVDVKQNEHIWKLSDGQQLAVRTLPAVDVISTIHIGDYASIGRAYQRVMDEIERLGTKTTVPSREIYLKGPGMIFRGNPNKYRTEIQIPVEG